MFIYKIGNYELISVDGNAHSADINGFKTLNDGRIISWGSDNKIKVWSYKN